MLWSHIFPTPSLTLTIISAPVTMRFTLLATVAINALFVVANPEADPEAASLETDAWAESDIVQRDIDAALSEALATILLLKRDPEAEPFLSDVPTLEERATNTTNSTNNTITNGGSLSGPKNTTNSTNTTIPVITGGGQNSTNTTNTTTPIIVGGGKNSTNSTNTTIPVIVGGGQNSTNSTNTTSPIIVGGGKNSTNSTNSTTPAPSDPPKNTCPASCPASLRAAFAPFASWPLAKEYCKAIQTKQCTDEP